MAQDLIEMTEQIEGIEGEAAAGKQEKEKGASLVEYALLVALIAVACIVAMRALGSKISQQFSFTADQV